MRFCTERHVAALVHIDSKQVTGKVNVADAAYGIAGVQHGINGYPSISSRRLACEQFLYASCATTLELLNVVQSSKFRYHNGRIQPCRGPVKPYLMTT